MKKIFIGISFILLSLLVIPNPAFAGQVNPCAITNTCPSPTDSTNPTISAPVDTSIQPLTNPTTINNLGDIFALLRKFLFAVIGVVLLGVMLYGGVLWLTSQGEPEQLKKAQSILFYGILGVVIIGLSVIIVHVIAAVLGINISGII